MSTISLSKTLQEIGLSEHESRVYVAALNLGPTTILQLAQASHVKRTTVYSIIESLQQRGLMSVEIRGLKKMFVAEHPDYLKTVLDEKKAKLDTIFPDLAALFHTHENSNSIKQYDGLPRIKKIYNALLTEIRAHEDYLVISQQEQWFKTDEEYFQKFIERRAKLNINIRMLLQDSPTTRTHKRFEKNYHETIKILPVDTRLTTNLIILPHKLLIHQLTLPYSVIVIEKPDVVLLHRELFEIIWKSIR